MGWPGPQAPPSSRCSGLLCQLLGPPLLLAAASWGSTRPAASAGSSGAEGSSPWGEEGGLAIACAGQQLVRPGQAGVGQGRCPGRCPGPHPCCHRCPGQDPGVVREGPVWGMTDWDWPWGKLLAEGSPGAGPCLPAASFWCLGSQVRACHLPWPHPVPSWMSGCQAPPGPRLPYRAPHSDGVSCPVAQGNLFCRV